MGIFGLIIIIPVILLYLLVGFVYLKITAGNANLISLGVFLVAGLAAGFLAMIGYGAVFADSHGSLNSASEVIGMFVLSGAVALVSSVTATHFLRRPNM
jgi:hypothetical protein